ncbi:hypothetical protein KAU33_04785 [Candidatus Dependentiae bacterium]|nr:hypothetical protein [Candidatus Dependentiae bacterium]
MKSKKLFLIPVILLVVVFVMISGCQKHSDQESPIQVIVERWDPLVGTVYRAGSYDGIVCDMRPVFLSSYSPIDIGYAIIKTIAVEVYYNNTKISSYNISTHYAMPVNSTSTLSGVILGWPHLYNYLNSHGAVNVLIYKFVFSGEDSSGKSISVESEITVTVL